MACTVFGLGLRQLYHLRSWKGAMATSTRTELTSILYHLRSWKGAMADNGGFFVVAVIIPSEELEGCNGQAEQALALTRDYTI